MRQLFVAEEVGGISRRLQQLPPCASVHFFFWTHEEKGKGKKKKKLIKRKKEICFFIFVFTLIFSPISYSLLLDIVRTQNYSFYYQNKDMSITNSCLVKISEVLFLSGLHHLPTGHTDDLQRYENF